MNCGRNCSRVRFAMTQGWSVNAGASLFAGAPGPAFGTWETTTLRLILAQDYAPPAHNEDRETHERNRRRGGSRVHVPRTNLSGTCPIRTPS